MSRVAVAKDLVVAAARSLKMPGLVRAALRKAGSAWRSVMDESTDPTNAEATGDLGSSPRVTSELISRSRQKARRKPSPVPSRRNSVPSGIAPSRRALTAYELHLREKGNSPKSIGDTIY